MGFMIEESRVPCGTAETVYKFPEKDGSQEFEVVYTAYVKSFMRQDGSASKLSGLHLADTRNCNSWVKGYIDRQLYIVQNGQRVKFGQSVEHNFFEFFATNDYIKHNIPTKIRAVIGEAFSLGGNHNVCSPEIQKAHLDLKAKMVHVVRKAIQELDAAGISALQSPSTIGKFIVEEIRSQRIKMAWSHDKNYEEGGFHDSDGVWHHPP